jgi:hypothetical protein
MLAIADEELLRMQKRDGVTPQDRVILRLLGMYVRRKDVKKRYSRVYAVAGQRRLYWLGNFVPPPVPTLTAEQEAAALKDTSIKGGVAKSYTLAGFRDGGMTGALTFDTPLNIISAVRHELAEGEHQLPILSLASDFAVYAGGRVFTVAEIVRRRRDPFPFGAKLVPMVR